MKKGRITFNNQELSSLGDCTFTISRQSDTASKPSSKEISIELNILLHSKDPSTQRAKLEALQQTIDVHEAEIKLYDNNNVALSYLATPISDNLKEALQIGSNSVSITLTALSLINDGKTGSEASFTPVRSSTIPLHNISNHNQTIRTVHAGPRSKHRTLTQNSITLSARTAYADPSLPEADRLAFLHQQKTTLENLNTSSGTLAWTNFSETVEIESLAFTIDDACRYLTVQLQARYNKLPDDSTAEANFTVDTSDACPEGELTTSINGTIEAKDRPTAIAKLDQIIATYHISPRRLEKKSITDKLAEGFDSSDFLGINFSIELKESSTEAGFNLDISSTESASGAKTTYSGTSKAASLVVALAKAQELGLNKHPVLESSTETISYIKDCSDINNPDFVQITFSYTYATASTHVTGTVSTSHSNPSFAEHQTTISGSLTAPTLNDAQTKARSFIPANTCLRANEENEGTSIHNANSQFVTLNFSYTYFRPHTTTTTKYKTSTSNNFPNMTATTTFNGTIWAPTLPEAETAYAALKPANTQLITETTSSDHETCPSGTSFTLFTFSFSYKTKLDGQIGTDIIDAQFSLERVPQIEQRPVTEIPCGDPIVQGAFGWTKGSLTASGSVKARLLSTARTWGQAKRAQASSYNAHSGVEQPPSERTSVDYLELSGTEITTYTFSFSYPFIYTDGLKELWPSGLTPS